MIISSLPAVRGRRSPLVLIAIALLVSGCAGPRVVTPEPPPIPEGGAPIPEKNEVVLSDGTQLVADAPWGRIKIEAGPGARRVYTWRNTRRGVVLKPREKRFAGSMGLHYEGKPPVWAPADGITKVDLEEGQLRFDTIDDAMIWMQIRRVRYTYNNSGLVVGWRPHGDTLQVELWQFYIDGKQPTSMPKASDSRISTGPLQVVPQKMVPVLVFADGHREPYAAQKTSSSSQTNHCNWFERMFSQCTVASADTAESTAQSKAQDNTQANTDSSAAAETAAATASKGTSPATIPEASDEAAGSTADKNTPLTKETNAPRAEIAAKVVNVRSRPSTDSDVLSQAKQGDPVRILKKDRGWRYVELNDGDRGWVADFLLDHEG